VDVLRPNERAESLGRGTGSFRGGWAAGCVGWSSFDCFRGGSRGGNEGDTDDDVGSRVVMLGVDFVGFKSTRVFSMVFSLLSGGNGGRVESPHAGAFNRDLASIEGDLDEIGVFAVPFPIDSPDMLDIAELVDSIESRRSEASEGLRGGKAGEGCVSCRRGNGGGAGFEVSAGF
jgi:hypothetical protein